MWRLRLALAALVSTAPTNALRVLGYRLMGYQIEGQIGYGTVIAVEQARIGHCQIGTFNRFIGPMSVEIGAGTQMGNRNLFLCGQWTADPQHAPLNYARRLKIGQRALVTSGHHFDVAGALEIGDGSWVAGTGTQFWTHGAGVTDRDITVGKDCYIGSAVRFAPGSAIGDKVLVAMGAVVARKFDQNRVMLGGVPAKVIKTDHDWKEDV